MAEQLTPDLCVIGGGAAGLSVAAAAAALGVPVVLIEKGRMGGECLNTGCVPSKAMIAAARRAEAFRTSGPFGIKPAKPAIEFAEVNDHIHRRHRGDRAERFQGALHRPWRPRDRGRGDASATPRPSSSARARSPLRDQGPPLRDRDRLAAGRAADSGTRAGALSHQRERVRDSRAAEASDRARRRPGRAGAGAGVPPARLRGHRAGRRLSRSARKIRNARPSCSTRFAREGITIRSGVKIERVRRLRQRIEVVLAGAAEETIQGTDLLVATGRRPNIDALDLQAARIKHEPDGIVVNKRFRTSNRRVYAIGDVTGLPAFTHSASHQASLLIRHLLFRLPIKMNVDEIPARHLHRSGARPCRPDRRAGARAPRRHPRAALALP